MPPLSDTAFRDMAQKTLSLLETQLEAADTRGLLEIDLEQGALAVTLPGGRQFLLTQHGPTRQLWLSSPISGGLHFSYDDAARDWQLPDGRLLLPLLADEMAALAGFRPAFAGT